MILNDPVIHPFQISAGEILMEDTRPYKREKSFPSRFFRVPE